MHLSRRRIRLVAFLAATSVATSLVASVSRIGLPSSSPFRIFSVPTVANRTVHARTPTVNLWNELVLRNSTHHGEGPLATRHFSSKSRYTSHRCVHHSITDHPDPTRFGIPDYVGRSCQFRNLYFRPFDCTFHYYASPLQSRLVGENTTALLKQITTSKGYVPRSLYNKPKRRHEFVFAESRNASFTPKLHLFDSNSSEIDHSNVVSVAALRNQKMPVFLLYKLSYVFNFGHFVFDDLLSLFSLLDIFGYASDEVGNPSLSTIYQHIPVTFPNEEHDFFYRCNHHSRWKECVEMYKRVAPLMGVQPVQEQNDDILSMKHLFRQSHHENPRIFVQLPVVLVGTGDLAYFGCTGPCGAQRVSRIYCMRAWVFSKIHLALNLEINIVGSLQYLDGFWLLYPSVILTSGLSLSTL